MISAHATNVLQGLSREIGEGWFRHQHAAGTADDLLQFITADGAFDAKIDGLIHAAALTTPFIIRHAREGQPELDLSRVTSWSATSAAARYAQWQVDFHWKIDTRLWQYLLLAKLMRRSYADAIRSADLEAADKSELLAANESFWDEVDVAYAYRMEVIERSRGFASHPDETAGAKDHAYSYRPLVPALNQKFSELRFELIDSSLGAGTAPERSPAPWPRLFELEHPPGVAAGAQWLKSAQESGIADGFLRAKLGERWVPTRITGWQAGVLETLAFLEREPAITKAVDTEGDSSLSDLAGIFAKLQEEFAHRLDGAIADIAKLLDCQRGALMSASSHTSADDIARFVDRSISSMHCLHFRRQSQGPTHLGALEDVCRPIHPRYAPVDPVEPLPWHTRNPERYWSRMKRLGYTL